MAPASKANRDSVNIRSAVMDDELTSGIERAVFGAVGRDNIDGWLSRHRDREQKHAPRDKLQRWMGPFRFGAATSDEPIVCGAERPGYGGTSVTAEEVEEWIRFMRQEGTKRIVCLLPDDQLRYYTNVPGGLLRAYEVAFGPERVSHHPIPDFRLCDEKRLRAILAVLQEADAAGEKVVVHCSGGIGRTGHVLAAWLVNARGYSELEAIRATRQMGRNAREPVEAGRASEADLMALLSASRPSS